MSIERLVASMKSAGCSAEQIGVAASAYVGNNRLTASVFMRGCMALNVHMDDIISAIDMMERAGFFNQRRDYQIPTPRISRNWQFENAAAGSRGSQSFPYALRTPRLPDRDWLPLIGSVLRRDGEKCRYCYDDFGPFEIDHVVPLSRGGTNDPDNLCVACKPCNASKGNLLLAEWEGRIGVHC